jgi:formylglycine-generating enzyme required for sulfatase activity
MNARLESVDTPVAPEGMVWIPGRTFRMGSDDHYPEKRRRIAWRSMASSSMQRR